MMLGDDLCIFRLVSPDDYPPTRAGGPTKYLHSKSLSTHRFKFHDMDENFYPLFPAAYPHLQLTNFLLKSVVISCKLYISQIIWQVGKCLIT